MPSVGVDMLGLKTISYDNCGLYDSDVSDVGDGSCSKGEFSDNEHALDELTDRSFVHLDNQNVAIKLRTQKEALGVYLDHAKSEIETVRSRILEETKNVHQNRHGRVEGQRTMADILHLVLTPTIAVAFLKRINRNLQRTNAPKANMDELGEFVANLCRIGYLRKSVTAFYKDVNEPEIGPEFFPLNSGFRPKITQERMNLIFRALSNQEKKDDVGDHGPEIWDNTGRLDPETKSIISKVSEAAKIGFVGYHTTVCIDDDKFNRKGKRDDRHGVSLKKIKKNFGATMHVAASAITKAFMAGSIQEKGQTVVSHVQALATTLTGENVPDHVNLPNCVALDRGYQQSQVVDYLVNHGADVLGTIPRTNVSAFVHGSRKNGSMYRANDKQIRVNTKGSKCARWASRRINDVATINCCLYRAGTNRIGKVHSTSPTMRLRVSAS